MASRNLRQVSTTPPLVMMCFVTVLANVATESKMLNRGVLSVRSDDVLLTRDQAENLLTAKQLLRSRSGSDETNERRRLSALVNSVELWTLPIFYKIDPSYYPEDREAIRTALAHITDHTCIPFFEVDAYAEMPMPHIKFIQHRAGCLSYIGRIQLASGEPQLLSLPYYCLQLGKAVHEILHSLGIWHEHQRTDRDRYIVVHDDVISARYAVNFRKCPWDGVSSFGLPYDYSSVMHYGSKQGSVNDSDTITPLDHYYKGNLGQRKGLSFLDAKLLNLVYCKGQCNKPLTCQNGGYPDPKNCDVCRCPPGLAGRLCTEVAPSVGAKCGGQYSPNVGDTITLTSPGFLEGKPYPDPVECSWLIQARANSWFNIRFSANFNVPNPGQKETCYNWLEVRIVNELALPGYRFCGERRPSEHLNMYSQSLVFILKSDLSDEILNETKPGFIGGFSLSVRIESGNLTDHHGSDSINQTTERLNYTTKSTSEATDTRSTVATSSHFRETKSLIPDSINKYSKYGSLTTARTSDIVSQRTSTTVYADAKATKKSSNTVHALIPALSLITFIYQ